MKILVIEDDESLKAVLRKRLVANGFNVECASNGQEGLDFLNASSFDVVISDVMMPIMNGLDFLKNVRNQKIDVPVILLTALDGSGDVVKGLDMGADDYIVKPFEFNELLARIRLVTRRKVGVRDNILEVADLSVDLKSHAVFRQQIEISLSTKEYNLLILLMKNKNVALSRDMICDSLYGFDDYIESNAIDVYIRFLRKKIDEGFDKKLICTIRGVGYMVKE